MKGGTRLHLTAILAAAACALAGCSRQGKEAASYADSLALVQARLPASSYTSNDYIPAVAPKPLSSVTKLKVGMAWIMNAEQAPWYVGIEKGFFRDLGLDLELVPGGPGKDTLKLLAGGSVDIATAEAGSFVVKLVASRTRSDVVAVGAELKKSPYCWLAIDNSVPRSSRSKKVLTPKDLVGAKVGLQPGYDYVLDFLASKYGLPRDDFRDSRTGFTPDPLVLGVVDYYAAWINNQPGQLEDQGYKNWTAFSFADWGLEEYASITVVQRATLNERPEVVRAYLFALGRSIQYILDHPDEATDITVRSCPDLPLLKASVLRRFGIERQLRIGSDNQPLQHMSQKAWDNLAALLLTSGQIELQR